VANNRVYIECTACGASCYLAKYYPSTGWYFLAPLSDDFMRKHADCMDHDIDIGPTHFILSYQAMPLSCRKENKGDN
jgi:hypothetical protein